MATPRFVHYQGKLRDSAGVAVTGTVSLRFRLYDHPTHLSPVLFDELHGSVGLSQGLFSVVIGSVAPGGLPDSVWSAAEVWLGVTPPSGPEMLPRTRIGAAPYARQSAALDGRQWQTGDPATGIKDYVDSLKISADNVLSSVMGGNFNTTNLTAGNIKQGVQIGAPSNQVTGDYPSVTWPLPGAGGTAALTQSDPTNGTYEWWKSDGARTTGSFDYPDQSSVASSDTVRGLVGTLTQYCPPGRSCFYDDHSDLTLAAVGAWAYSSGASGSTMSTGWVPVPGASSNYTPTAAQYLQSAFIQFDLQPDTCGTCLADGRAVLSGGSLSYVLCQIRTKEYQQGGGGWQTYSCTWTPGNPPPRLAANTTYTITYEMLSHHSTRTTYFRNPQHNAKLFVITTQ